ncbi:hypothetical protein Aduo_018719 [Ancylostoma duodenale]
MTGPVQLKSQKGLLTRYRNILNQLITKYSEAFKTEVSPRLLSEMSYELNTTSKLVIEALENFTKTVDQVEEFQSGDQETQIQDYIDKTHTVLENAQTLTIQMERKKVGLQQPMTAQESAIAELSSAKETEESFAFSTIHMEVEKDTQFPLFRYATLIKSQLIIAWVLRFIRRCMNGLPTSRIEAISKRVPELRQTTTSGPLTGPEMQFAKQALIRNHQLSVLSCDYIKSMSKRL